MSDESKHEGLHIDSDWKTEAAREKEKLAEQEQKQAQSGAGPQGPVGFLDLVMRGFLALILPGQPT